MSPCYGYDSKKNNELSDAPISSLNNVLKCVNSFPPDFAPCCERSKGIGNQEENIFCDADSHADSHASPMSLALGLCRQRSNVDERSSNGIQLRRLTSLFRSALRNIAKQWGKNISVLNASLAVWCVAQ
jgi:hypothetical protein